MTPKIVLVTIGILMTLQGIGLYLGAGSIEEYTNPTKAILAMGSRLNETIGVMTLLVGVLSLASFNIDSNSAKKVVFGTGIAMAICCAFSLERHVNQVWNGEGMGDPCVKSNNFWFTGFMVFLCWLKKGLKRVIISGKSIHLAFLP